MRCHRPDANIDAIDHSIAMMILMMVLDCRRSYSIDGLWAVGHHEEQRANMLVLGHCYLHGYLGDPGVSIC